MTGWKRAARIPARRNRRQSVVLNLESLEDRLLLNASLGGLAASALKGDLAQLSNDVASAPLALVNAARHSQLVSQWQKETNTLAADWSKTWQDVASNELNALAQTPLGQIIEWADNRIGQALAAIHDWWDTLLSDLDQQLGILPPSPPPNAPAGSGGEGATQPKASLLKKKKDPLPTVYFVYTSGQNMYV